MTLTRRSFNKGAISLLAAIASKPMAETATTVFLPLYGHRA